MQHIFKSTAEKAPVTVTVQMGKEALQTTGVLALAVSLEDDQSGATVTILGDSNPETVGALLNGLVDWLGDMGVAGLIANALQNYQIARAGGFVGPGVQGPPAPKQKPCDGCPDDDTSAG